MHSLNPVTSADPSSVVECYREFQRNRKTTRTEDVPAQAQRVFDVARRSGVWDALISTFDHVARGSSAGPDAVEYLPGLSEKERLQLIKFLFQYSEPLTDIVLSKAENGYWPPELSELPLHREAVVGFFSELEESYIRASVNRHIAGDAKQPYSYQIEALRRASFDCRSPFSGRVVSNPAAFVAPGRNDQHALMYLFRDGDEVFVLTTDYLYGAITGIYLPKYNTALVRPNARLWRDSIAQLRALMVVMPRAAVANVTFEGKRPIALLHGSINHFGHTVCNELEAFSQCAANNLFAGISAVVRGTTLYFPHEQLFPEVRDAAVIDLDFEPETYRALMERGYLLVRPTCGSHWFSAEQRNRFVRAERQFQAVVSRPKELNIASACRPLIWVEVRSNDRFWLEQTEGIAALARRLQQDYPKLGIILAGWSVPGVTRASRADRHSIAADRAITTEIKRQIGTSMPVFDITGVSTPEKAVWALRSHAFVATYSSGIIFPVCIGNNSGVLHASTYMQTVAIESAPGGKLTLMQDCPPLIFLDPSKMTDAESEVAAEANYHLDWRHIYEPLVAVLSSLGSPGRRQRPHPLTRVRRSNRTAASNSGTAGSAEVPMAFDATAKQAAPATANAMQPEQGTRDKVVEFLVSASSFASGIGASPCFHQNRLSLEEWMALAALRRGGARRRGGAARRGAGNAAAVAKALNVSRKRANEMIRSLLAEKLIEAAVGENQKRALVVSAPGIARMEAVADCLYAQIKSAAGENLTQVLRFNRTFRLLNREFSAEAEAATD